MIEICWNWGFFFQVSCKVILYIIFFYWAKCIAWCKVFESHLFSVALEHYSSEMCFSFSATVVHKDVLLKFVSSSQWVIQPMQLVHMSVLDDWCNMYRFQKYSGFQFISQFFPVQILQSCDVWFVLDFVWKFYCFELYWTIVSWISWENFEISICCKGVVNFLLLPLVGVPISTPAESYS